MQKSVKIGGLLACLALILIMAASIMVRAFAPAGDALPETGISLGEMIGEEV